MGNDDLLEIPITWKHTGDAEFPYTAEVRGQVFTIRINDFPAEPLYSLLLADGAELMHLDDWPPAWSKSSPPKALLDMLVTKRAPRLEGAVRLVATSARDEPIESKPLVALAHAALALEAGDQERILALAPEQGVAISARTSERGDEVRLHLLRSSTRRGLAVGQRRMLAASVAADGGSVIVLDEEGGVLRYDLSTFAHPASARTRRPAPGGTAFLDLAPGGRLWLAATGASVEVRLMHDQTPVATVDLSPLGGEVTSAHFLPDASGFLVTTASALELRFELLLDRVGASREARVAAIADAVDAALAGTQWDRYAPRIHVHDEQTEGGRTTLHFVADHFEYHHAQSGSDWATHDLCAGQATFEGARRVEVQVTSPERKRLTERQAEDYDDAAALAAFREAAAQARSPSTLT